MASPDASTNGDAQPTVEQITFRFCRNCSNLLYPEENKHERKLVYKCRTCIYSEDAASMCVHRRQLMQTVGETAGVTQDVGNDPTVGDIDAISLNLTDCSSASEAESADMCMCTLCGEEIVCDDCGEGIELVELPRSSAAKGGEESVKNKATSGAVVAQIRELRVDDMDES